MSGRVAVLLLLCVHAAADMEFNWCLSDSSCRQNGDSAAMCVAAMCECGEGFSSVSTAAVCVRDEPNAGAHLLVEVNFPPRGVDSKITTTSLNDFMGLIERALLGSLGGEVVTSEENDNKFSFIFKGVPYTAMADLDVNERLRVLYATDRAYRALQDTFGNVEKSVLTVLLISAPESAEKLGLLAEVCQSAWLRLDSNTCFDDIPNLIGGSTFGWSNTVDASVNGPLFVGPGTCAAGSQVAADVQLDLFFPVLTVSMTMQPGWTLQEASIHAGSSVLPIVGTDVTADPSQFAHAFGLPILLTEVPTFVAVHAIVCSDNTLVPETAVPVPETDMPETDAPETAAPPTDAPATDAPETVAPPTDAPATDAPATDAPETVAPPTDVPATDAPATDAPATDAPETVAPPTDAPASGSSSEGSSSNASSSSNSSSDGSSSDNSSNSGSSSDGKPVNPNSSSDGSSSSGSSSGGSSSDNSSNSGSSSNGN